MSNFQADTASSFLLIEDFQKFCPDLSTKLEKFVWEVPYSVPYAIGLDNGGKLHIHVLNLHLASVCFRN